MTQKYTSKDTSINTVSAVYKNIVFPQGSVILDYGGGKYDTNKIYMKENFNCEVLVYDPYNRSKEYNQKVIQYFQQYPAFFVVCSNVLNVIQEDKVILEILQNIYSLMNKQSILYIKIYERDKSGTGCETNKGWQRNQKTDTYISYIIKVFGDNCVISKKKDVLIVKKM